MNWYTRESVTPSSIHHDQALERQTQLTKPPGSLGRLEELAVTLAALQHTATPQIVNSKMVIFAADHGVVAEGISAFPQAVTVEMIRNFANGGAAICTLAKAQQIPLEVINLGTVNDASEISGINHQIIRSGSANFAQQAAMSDEELQRALKVGATAVEEAGNLDVFMAGEMGIGNTSSASALISALLNIDPEHVTGPGTGLDKSGVSHKIQVIKQALKLHQNAMTSPLEILRHLGGLEITALVGAYIRAGQLGIPILVDGFICAAAALCAQHINSSLKPWLLLSHCSAEPGFQVLLEHFSHPPLVDLNMRLGEGSGAATCLPLLKLACTLHNNMATFAEAAVSGKS